MTDFLGKTLFKTCRVSDHKVPDLDSYCTTQWVKFSKGDM